MNLNAVNRLATHVLRFVDTKKPTEPIIATLPQKPEIPAAESGTSLERVTPESMGVPSQLIRGYVEAIEADKTQNVHNITILRGGKIIYECNFGGQDVSTPKMTFSACKSITSLAIGMLIDEGKLSLEESAASVFEGKVGLIDKLRMDNITVEDLLTMRSGIVFNEAECMGSTNWVKSYFSSAIQGKIGETFNYNSLNTYMLSAIVYKKTGTHLAEYLSERLFEPLGIASYAWEKCPMGIEKGGWGLYMRPEDMGKIGTLVMNGGVWQGKRIISEEYLKKATSAHAITPKEIGDFNYGYQIWVGKETDTFLFNGMLGQNVLGFRENGIIVVANAGNGELFQQGSFYGLTLKTFCGAFPEKIAEDRWHRAALERYSHSLVFGGGSRRLANKHKVYEELSALFERTYEADDENAPSFGLMPAILQLTQNNYAKGMKKIDFRLNKERCCVEISFEEKDCTRVLYAGLLHGEKTELDFGGEKFSVCAFARLAANEDGVPVLIVRADFTETPCSRVFKFFFEDERMVCNAGEDPGVDFIVKTAGDVIAEAFSGTMVSKLAEKIDMGYISYKLEKVFSPKIIFAAKARASSKEENG
ncbi:MAG: serine hydrolase [Clostridia bacterium]|nr:serine hydrolase [Clostridia bacterium]